MKKHAAKLYSTKTEREGFFVHSKGKTRLIFVLAERKT